MESGAVHDVCYEDALAQARVADQARENGEALGRLHGIPLSVKEG
jgi:Asp-tRNA(Asn)/Glu-tRNA(Gln) amidotransferase A subunit family amidase